MNIDDIIYRINNYDEIMELLIKRITKTMIVLENNIRLRKDLSEIGAKLWDYTIYKSKLSENDVYRNKKYKDKMQVNDLICKLNPNNNYSDEVINKIKELNKLLNRGY